MNEESQLRGLLDRAQIHDLLARFVHCLDRRDFAGYAALFTEDGMLRLPGSQHRGRAGLAEFVAADLGRYHRTHHMSTNHEVDITGDTAASRSSLHAVHMRSADDPTDWWSVGGWYEHSYRRVAGVWLIETVDVTPAWLGEGP